VYLFFELNFLKGKDMGRDKVLAILEQHWGVLKSFGVRSLSIFGSVARDEARSDSDVDILVELEPPITFDRYMESNFTWKINWELRSV
jgi:predicted nucleotidyltransferase